MRRQIIFTVSGKTENGVFEDIYSEAHIQIATFFENRKCWIGVDEKLNFLNKYEYLYGQGLNCNKYQMQQNFNIFSCLKNWFNFFIYTGDVLDSKTF